jgi:hypothetical protein
MNKLLLGCVLGAGLSSGCLFVSDDPGPARRADFTGALVVDWSINGTTNPDRCDQSDATSLRVSVFTTSGDPVGDFVDDCAVFSTSIELDPGSYYADAVLEDAAGHARTTPVPIDDFAIRGADTFSVPIDFPASSFY